MRPLVWFRSDLRVSDNAALFHAGVAARRGVVAAFTVCPRQWRAHDWSTAKVDFILRNLDHLAQRLKELRIPLRILVVPDFAAVPAALLELARETACDALFYNREYEINERRRDEAVLHLLRDHGIRVHPFHDQTVVAPDALRTHAQAYYRVFTPFQRAWTSHVREQGPGELLGPPPMQPALPCPPDKIPAQVAGFDLVNVPARLWPAGEMAAARQLNSFIADQLGRYHNDRDHPARGGTSRLSPYLATGVLSARSCLSAVLDANHGRLSGGRAGAAAWITELVWREFYRHVLVGFPRVCMGRAFQVDTERVEWRDDEAAFRAWCDGRTGYPLVDAGMRQLTATGWMHNRLRMVTAMFLAKTLLIDWRRGERFFMQQLIDGDLASNNGGWQWAASTGTDAAPYFRVFNPVTQSRRFDPAGDIIRHYVPELRTLTVREIHEPWKLSGDRFRTLGYPPPLCDLAHARRRALQAFAAIRAKRHTVR